MLPSSGAEALIERLRQAGVEATLHPDIKVAIWEKFLGVCGTHALTALTRLPLGPLFACSATRGLVEGLMKEAEEVGRALGVAVPRGSAAEADFPLPEV